MHVPGARAVPPALERAETEVLGEGYARASRARQNTIPIEDGYRAAQVLDAIQKASVTNAPVKVDWQD